ncbi:MULTISPECIES: DUF2043 domain-containing protein [Mycobacteroides]|uniref:Uncharacterized protein n=1 Tax=Mycobacteroides chelonae TaxID=1774 RepID=A0A1S1LPU8_MYCCH|nr:MULTISPECIES: DUF2043 domain-containing protein [Mycobacteroides]KRQ25970.1 hypothetical protein AOT87_07370 [Mycobacteroides sp. H003]KRQ35095.1 hypothetical protein AOT91_05785 [Mycobacteroides sp. H092]KRQ39298.1 hypothetical protein AOT92_18560 [Mycobacteroides sp. H101]KRQ48675.1 hypothetical protein AOT88_13370 [Mycobacteroides sp. H063]KRQ58777.1 hypothetical protein AOT94_11020 [Mycobacteroides sp. HXVII]
MSEINGTENVSEIGDGNTEGNIGVEPSSNSRIVKWSEQWWAEKAKPGVRRCKAHRKNGNRCQRAAMDGTTVCPTHGGKAPQVQAAARRRLAEATDRMARELLKMAVDPNVNDAVKLKAMTEALDRGGVTTKAVATVEITAKPFEEIFDADVVVTAGGRADYRRSRGIADDSDTPTALASSTDLPPLEPSDSFSPIDVEFSDDESGNVRSQGRPMSRDDAQRQPYGRLAGQTGPFCGEAEGMQSLEDAVEAQAEMRRRAAAMGPIRRALPPGHTAHG